jgi:HPt (histidine-containing phosphotransfer) domain-containing protein
MIDWGRVRDLHDEIGAESFAEVLELFVQEVDEALSRLRDATDPVAASGEFHFLKGAALNLGLDTIAELCAQGEKAAAAAQDTHFARTRALREFPSLNADLLRDWRQQFGVG